MPLKLNDMSSAATIAASKSVYSATFFDKAITGKGGRLGVLCEAANPSKTSPKVKLTIDMTDPTKRKFKNGNTTTLYIPLTPLVNPAWDLLTTIDKLPTKPVEFARYSKYPDVAFYIGVEPTALVIQTSESNSGQTRVTERKLSTTYRLFIARICDSAKDVPLKQVTTTKRIFDGGTFNVFCTQLIGNVPNALTETLQDAIDYGKVTVNKDAVLDYLAKYSLYDHVALASKHWQTTIDEEINNLITNVVNVTPKGAQPSDVIMSVLYEVLSRMEAYKVPLPMYLSIYDHMANSLPMLSVRRLSKANLNLLLSDTMQALTSCKSSLERVCPLPNTNPSANHGKQPGDILFSPDQCKAIESDEPLVLIQSGAGSGKSTTIKGRLNYMSQCGINPHDIMVLSFTNAAADHISDIAPQVHSMTIAKMIHTIYEVNYPNHTLSSEDTLINSLDIYFPNDPFAMNFKRVLASVNKGGDPSAATRLNSFVENHFDEVMRCLDVTGQTTLNLEIVICYQKIDTLTEPPEVTSRHLIIDEVQDNSIFEFVYALRYVAKHKESLYIVGDASQTLYEFRASNPRALNVMEASGMFATYKLQVNYRSNQEILNFANITLADIEANRYAQIQLQANSLSPVTAKSFSERVRLTHFPLSKLGDLEPIMQNNFADYVVPYVQERLALGQKVCFLAYRRQHITMFEEQVERYFPNVPKASLVPDRIYNSTIFSMFIKKYWDEMKFAPTGSLAHTIRSEIITRLPELIGAKRAVSAINSVSSLLNEWTAEIAPSMSIWQGQVTSGIITHNEMLDHIKEHMLDFEIKRNTARQAVLSSRNADEKNSDAVKNAQILFSTIHSAKGLEFDNTVILYQAANNLDEEDKRMYYVAFTRAMHSELILTYERLKNPAILTTYNAMVAELQDCDAKAMLARGGGGSNDQTAAN